MPPDARGWLVRLVDAAPSVDMTLLRIIARMLASDIDPEILLVLDEALEEAAAALRLDMLTRQAGEIDALRAIVARVDRPSVGRSEDGNFW